jgi:hypothetical protein
LVTGQFNPQPTEVVRRNSRPGNRDRGAGAPDDTVEIDSASDPASTGLFKGILPDRHPEHVDDGEKDHAEHR